MVFVTLLVMTYMPAPSRAVRAHSYSMINRSWPVILTCQRTEKIRIKDPLILVKMSHLYLSPPQIWVKCSPPPHFPLKCLNSKGSFINLWGGSPCNRFCPNNTLLQMTFKSACLFSKLTDTIHLPPLECSNSAHLQKYKEGLGHYVLARMSESGHDVLARTSWLRRLRWDVLARTAWPGLCVLSQTSWPGRPGRPGQDIYVLLYLCPFVWVKCSPPPPHFPLKCLNSKGEVS